MKLHPEDPRLTACALGELGDDEMHAVEEAVQEDLLLRAEVEGIDRMREYLTANLAMPAETLTGRQRDAVMRAAKDASRSHDGAGLRETAQRWIIPAAAAAVLAGTTTLLMRMPHDNPPATKQAKTSTTTPTTQETPKATVVATPPAPEAPATSVRNGPVLAAQFPTMELPIRSRRGFDELSKAVMAKQGPVPREQVRLEEMLNSFSFRFDGMTAVGPPVATWHPDARDELTPTTHTASLTAEMIACPWKPSAALLFVSLRGNSRGDCLASLSLHADPATVARYQLLGFDPPSKGSAAAEASHRLEANRTVTMAIEIEPSGANNDFGSLEWTIDEKPAPPIRLIRKPDTEPSEDARFASLVCAYSQWLAGNEATFIDAELVAALGRENTSATLPPDRAKFLTIVDRSLHP